MRDQNEYFTCPIPINSLLNWEQQSQIYQKYLCAYIELIITIIKNGQKSALHYPEQIGLTFDFCKAVISKTTKPKLLSLFIKFLTAKYVNNHASYGDFGFSNRSY